MLSYNETPKIYTPFTESGYSAEGDYSMHLY